MPFARRKRRTPRPAASSTAPPGNAWPRLAPNAGLAVQCWPGRGRCRRRRREWGRSCAAWRGSGLIAHPQGAGHVCCAAFLSCAGLAARGLQRSSPAAQGQTIQAAPVAGALRLHARRRTVPPDAGHGLRTVAVYGLVFAGLPARAAPGFRGEPTYGGAFRAAALQTAAHHVLIHKHM